MEKVTLELRMALLIVKIAHMECDERVSGVDGKGYGFCQTDYPEEGSAAGFGDNELEAAITFLEAVYL